MAFSVWISKCSGAMSSEIRTQCSMVSHLTAKLCFSACKAVDLFGSGSAAICNFTAISTCSITSSEVLNKMARATTSCSACAMRSAATTFGLAVSSQMTNTSDGPASMSIPHLPLTIDLAAVTHLFPGPQITSHRGISTPSVGAMPYAIAPIACAPPTQRKVSTSAMWAAAIVIFAGLGLASTTVSQPAARAVTAVMMTDEGSGYRPPGA
mmetsp:Transcript_4783/g.13778  ORF Transcript_4783/g.13778 Transcript_4783/m.13778 type:complete len:210 (-) Transcript_4783:565-1194(-)